MKKIFEKSGITMIALIVTIIVLLILAGIAITAVVGDNGVVKNTQHSKLKMEESNAREEVAEAWVTILADYDERLDEVNKEKFNKYLNGASGVVVDFSIEDDENATVNYKIKDTGNEYSFWLDADGDINFNYGWTKNPDGTLSNGNIINIKVGDYVDYDPTLNATNGLTYTSYSEGNASSEKNNGRTSGYEIDQIFNAALYKNSGYRWRVFDIKNGKIRIISEEPFGPGNFSAQNKTTFYLSGKKGYIYGKDELNAICEIFGHGKGAESSTSIKEEDIFSETGYNPNNLSSSGNVDDYGNIITYYRGSGNNLSSTSSNGNSWSGTVDIFYYFDGIDFVLLTSGNTQVTNTLYYKDFKKDVTNEGVLKEDGTYCPEYEMIFGKVKFNSSNNYSVDNNYLKKTAPEYWLASRCNYAYSNGVFWGYNSVRGNEMGVEFIFYYDNTSNTYNYGVRPIVTLKSSTQLNWDSSKEEWKIK